MGVEINHSISAVIAYAVGPAVENLQNQELIAFYHQLIDEISGKNFMTKVLEIVQKMDELIGKEYDCELYELEQNDADENFFAYRALTMVKCAFDQNDALNGDMTSLSLFKQFNQDLDSLYIKRNKKGKTDSALLGLLLQYDLRDSGEELIHSSLEMIDRGNEIAVAERCKSYQDALYRKLEAVKSGE